MDSVQTLIWLSGTPVGRILEHSDEEWLASIQRQVRAEKEREKKCLEEKKDYDGWTKKYEDYLKWCEDRNKKPSALNHLKYKFRNKTGTSFPWMRSKKTTDFDANPEAKRDKDKMKAGANKSTEKGQDDTQQEHAESPEAAGGATNDKPEPATEKPATETVKSQQDSKDEQPQTSEQSTTAIATDADDTVKDQSGEAQDTVKTDGDEVKATPLTLEHEIEELKKQIAILTMKIGDGMKQT